MVKVILYSTTSRNARISKMYREVLLTSNLEYKNRNSLEGNNRYYEMLTEVYTRKLER